MNRTGWSAPGAIALRSRDFRLFWFGNVVEVSGQQMLWVAQGWLIYELSGSAFLLGAAGLMRAGPAFVLSLVGGALADKWDQRRLLIWIQVVQLVLLAALGAITAVERVEVWHLLLILSASAAVQSLENPARQAIFPRLVPRGALMDAVALNATVHPGTRFFGPVLAGLLMAQIRIVSGSPMLGPATLFFLATAGYVANAGLLYLIRTGPVEGSGRNSSVLGDMIGGINFVGANPIFMALIAMTYCSHFFGWSFQSLFPIFAKDIFHGGEFELGLMHSALGAGSLLGAMAATNLASVQRRGLLISGGFILQALLLLAVSAAPIFSLAVIGLVLAGLSQSVFNVSTQSTLQYLVPNDYRGRVMGIWGMTHNVVQPMGQLQMGALAAAISAPAAVALGALVMIAIGLAMVLPNRRVRGLNFALDNLEGAPSVERPGGVPVAARH